jgi:hypothetical protein
LQSSQAAAAAVALSLQFLVGLIIFPCGSLWAGVILQTTREPLDDVRATYSTFILLFLVSTYMLATTGSLVLHNWLITPRLRHLEEVEIEWRTHDMMFFTVSCLPLHTLHSLSVLAHRALNLQP